MVIQIFHLRECLESEAEWKQGLALENQRCSAQTNVEGNKLIMLHVHCKTKAALMRVGIVEARPGLPDGGTVLTDSIHNFRNSFPHAIWGLTLSRGTEKGGQGFVALRFATWMRKGLCTFMRRCCRIRGRMKLIYLINRPPAGDCTRWTIRRMRNKMVNKAKAASTLEGKVNEMLLKDIISFPGIELKCSTHIKWTLSLGTQ